MVICQFAPYTLAHWPKSCQQLGFRRCGMHVSEIAGWIYPIWSFMDLSWPVLVQCHSYLPICPIWVCSWAKNWSNQAALGPDCGTHISEFAGWIYTIWSSMELFRPVVVQHHGHLTLTLDFQGQIFKNLHLRNGRADWHGTKGMWVDRMLDPHCDFELWPHPWPWHLIFKVKFWNSCIPGIGGPIDMERKGYEWIGCYTYFVTMSYDVDLGFSWSNFENAVSQEWEGRLTWNHMDVSR